MHALIIEDELIIAMSLEGILADCGFTSFDVACSMEQAIAAARVRCPALITADVQLNPGNGIDAVDEICCGPPIPVVFITGSPDEVVSRMPQHLLILKPFTKEVVSRAVRLSLETSRSMHC
jgi:CheY-like chemotaxis protein